MVNQSTVLLICDNAEFSKAVTGHWEVRRGAPAFTVTKPDVCHGTAAEGFDLAIVGPIGEAELASLLDFLRPTSKPVIVVGGTVSTALQERCFRAVFLPQNDGWLDVLVVVASEMLQRAAAVARADRAEQGQTRLQCDATLGKYMLEMRHNLNNALTSVLGNSELLLLEPGSLSAGTRSQVETIRNMAIRMHEILQRFTSIEKELKAVDQQSTKPTRVSSNAASAR